MFFTTAPSVPFRAGASFALAAPSELSFGTRAVVRLLLLLPTGCQA